MSTNAMTFVPEKGGCEECFEAKSMCLNKCRFRRKQTHIQIGAELFVRGWLDVEIE